MLDSIRGAYSRLTYRKIVEKMADELVGTQFHVPILETEQRQVLRQKPDYEELLIEFYANPSLTDTSLKSDDVVYSITEAEVRESRGILYRLQRALGNIDFNGKIRFYIKLEEERIPSTPLTAHPDYKELDGWIDHYHRGEYFEFFHEFDNIENLCWDLYRLNQLLAAVWESPETIQEIREDIDKWRVFNQFKEQSR